jgi:hypothetical protein
MAGSVPRALAATTLGLSISVAAATAISVDADPPPEALPAYVEEIFVVDQVPLVLAVADGEPIRIVFGVGELDVEAVDGSELRADVILDCRDVDRATCLERGKRLRIEPTRTPSGLEIRMAGLSKRWLRKIGVTGSVRVPRTSPLALDIGIGDIDVVSGDQDLEVSMGIGDLSVEAAEESVGSVVVRTRIGDASFTQAGEQTPGKRAMLIGAKVRWQDGEGPASIRVGLRIGDARVRLR